MLDQEIINDRFTRLEKLIRESRPKEKRTWVSVGIVKEVTGWEHKFLQKAREQGLIKFRMEGNSFKYLLQSIPDVFIKK